MPSDKTTCGKEWIMVCEGCLSPEERVPAWYCAKETWEGVNVSLEPMPRDPFDDTRWLDAMNAEMDALANEGKFDEEDWEGLAELEGWERRGERGNEGQTSA